MSTAILRPAADGATLQLTPSTGTSHYALVDEAVADDADYLSNLTAGSSQYDLLTLGTLSLPDGAVITKVVATVRCKATTSGSLYVRLVNTAGTGILIPMGTVPPAAWGDVVSRDVRLCPSTGQAWTAADLSGKTLSLWCASSDGTFKISQVYLTVSYFIPALNLLIETLRPNADKAISGLTPYPSSPTTRYDKIDEVTEDTADYCYTTGGATLSTFELTGSALAGVIDHIRVKAKVKYGAASATANLVGLALNESTAANVPEAARQDTVEFQAEAIYDVDPATGVAWAWSDIPALFVGLKLGATASAGYVYQLWVEVYYKPVIYFDSITCNSAGGGYVAVSGTLRLDASTIAKKQAQVASDPTFGTTLVDSTLLDAAETAGTAVVITMSWAPSSAGTYYARLGVRSASEATLTWVVVAFVVAFPTIDAVTVAQSEEHATITVNVTDTYAHPPTVTVYIDHHAVSAEVTDRTPDSYVYKAYSDVSRGEHTLSVQVNNIWAVVSSSEQTFTATYDLHESSVKVYWGDRQIKAWGFTWTDPLLPDVPSCSFSSDEEITGQIRVVLRRRGYEERTYKVTRHSKQGSSWSMSCDAVEKSQLNTLLSLQVQGSTANDLMQQAMGNIAPAADYATLMPQWFYGQSYQCRASELIDQLLIQSGVTAWLQAGRWNAASSDAPAIVPLAWSKREPQVGYEADDTIYNRVRAHYAIAQYPVPSTALTEKDAANWTGTITDVALTDNLLPAPSGAWYLLRGNGNVSRTGLSITLAPFDRLKLNWLPETATTLAIKLKQDASNYLSYTRTFAGSTGSGFIATGTTASSTATYTVTATIRPVVVQGYMTQPCSVVVTLKKSGATVLAFTSQSTVGAENHWQVSVPASVYQADTITDIEMVFSNLYPVNSGYGVNCSQLLIDEYKQVATITGSTREITYRSTLSCSMPVQTHYTYANYEEWGFAGIIGKVPTLETDEQWDIMYVSGGINCKIYDYTAAGGLRSVRKEVPVFVTILGDDIWVGSNIATDPGYAGADGQIASVSGGSASAVLVKYLISSTSTLSWVIQPYAWSSTYNLWDAIDIPLTSFAATGTTRTITSIELTCTGINNLDALHLAASNPIDKVVEAVSGAGDVLYPDEATGFNSLEAAQAWARGMLDRVSVARPSYTKVMPIGEDVSLGEWVNCDGTPLQVRAIQGDMDAGTITVSAGADQQTLAATLREQSRALDELKRR